MCYSRKMHNRKCTLKPLGDMTLGGGNRILVGMMGTNNSNNKPREKIANSNRTGGDASRDLALNSQGVGASFSSATTCDDDDVKSRLFFQRVQAGNALRHTNQYDRASRAEEPLCGALSFKHYPYLTLSVLNDIHDQPCIE